GPKFWHGIAVEERSGNEDWLNGIDLVVLPAFVEHKPRRLLEAVARSTPVIASTACGLKNIQGVINVPMGDVEALREAIKLVIPDNPS
ncbi:MAG TPA: glycosyltransferase, partial [Pyrinomonadaceae bacterium]|nr:glycosyltransferase [Pyrinomonadaceae bacterium]